MWLDAILVYIYESLMKRNENQFKASVKAIAASDANNSSVGCNEPFLREIARK
jgi:hypothetical protein